LSARASAVFAASSLVLLAQSSLPEAVRQAGEKYPGVQVSLEQVRAASAGVQLARTQFLPKADFLAQVNRATHNNVYGMLLPNQVIAPISGPARMSNDGSNVWGSATGFLVSWEPFDFGVRDAQVNAASAGRARAEAAVARTRFEVESAAAEAFLTILAADRSVESARAAVERARSVEQVVAALVKAELRPGADGARATAERAQAEARVVQTELAARMARAALTQLTGTPAAALTAPPNPPSSPDLASSEHPLLREQRAAIEESAARQKVLDKTWVPRFQLQSALYARGTGVNPDFTTGGGASGLGPNIYNWGVGFTMLFPLLEQPGIRAQKEIEAARARTETAQLDKIRRDLSAQLEKSRAALDAARRVAALTPIQLDAARAAFDQAQARYRSGLSNITEVAEAQRLLVEADTDQALAQLSIWRALLAVATSQGDLAPFLQLAAGK
jgi:outer membrane protein TolC